MIVPVWTGKKYLFENVTRTALQRGDSYEALHSENIKLRVTVSDLRTRNVKLQRSAREWKRVAQSLQKTLDAS